MPRIAAWLMLRSTSFTVSAPADSPFRGSIAHPTHSLCTLRGWRCRRLTQHSLPGGPLRPYLCRTRTGRSRQLRLAPSKDRTDCRFPLRCQVLGRHIFLSAESVRLFPMGQRNGFHQRGSLKIQCGNNDALISVHGAPVQSRAYVRAVYTWRRTNQVLLVKLGYPVHITHSSRRRYARAISIPL